MTIPLKILEVAAKSVSDTDWDRVVTTLVTDMSGLFQNVNQGDKWIFI